MKIENNWFINLKEFLFIKTTHQVKLEWEWMLGNRNLSHFVILGIQTSIIFILYLKLELLYNWKQWLTTQKWAYNFIC